MPAVIRPMRARDAAAVARLAGQLGYPSSATAVRQRFAAIVRRGSARVLVAIGAGGAVVGWVHVHARYTVESEGEAEIGALVVCEDWRGHGVGAALMAAAEAWAARRGLTAVRVRSNIVRRGAHRFSRRLGYVRVKTQHNCHKAIRP